jgi:EAL domain-containing protein (putative c-di-GMP-specific phosphodiesterase class I)
MTIIRATSALASGLGLTVIADGVESESQRLMLLDTGCRMFQGYLFGRPMPLKDFEELAAALRLPLGAPPSAG